ncbi:MAG: hypothetical protein ACPGQS_11980 [Bradymonadia bacterium]
MSKLLAFLFLLCLLTGCAFISEPDVGPGSNYSGTDWPEDGNTGGPLPSQTCEDGGSIDCESEPGSHGGNEPEPPENRCVDESDAGGLDDQGTDDSNSETSEDDSGPEDSNCENQGDESEEAQDTSFSNSTQVDDATTPHLPEDADVEETDDHEEQDT